jgi:HEAT repeat protein
MAQDVKELIRSLNSRDNEERAEAAKSISSLAKKGTSDVASIKPLISCLFDSNRFVRHNSAFAIGDLAEFCGVFDGSAVSPLQRLLSDRDDVVRWSAAFALRTYAKKSGYDMGLVQCFAGLLLDSNQRVRYNAAYAVGYLAQFGAFDKSTIYPLIGLLSDRNGIVRGSAAFAIGCLAKQDIFDVAAIKPLMSLLSDYNGIVRKNAAEALKIFQEKNIVINSEKPHTQINVRIGHEVAQGGKVIDTGDKSLNLSKLINDIEQQSIGLKTKKSLYCPACGNATEGNTRFCINCGNPLNLD